MRMQRRVSGPRSAGRAAAGPGCNAAATSNDGCRCFLHAAGAWLRGLEEGAAAAAATASAAWPAATALDSSSGWLGGTPMQLVPVTASGEQLGPVAAAGAASPDPA